MTIQMIALNQLVASPLNVRKTGGAMEIEALAASIAAHGLLQNLQVRATANGKFEVVAGGRRLAALKLLAKQKKMAKAAEIPCHVLEGEDAVEISLAENILRVPMHPADQFNAFFALAESGKGIEEIAARFGTSPTIVRQRLKLAAVSPALIALYREEEMSLDQLMAFTVSDDHEAQEAAWRDLPSWQRQPHAIRRALTAAHVQADDARVAFVTLEAYEAAGGSVIRDLFQPEDAGYLTDTALLDKLVMAKLEQEAAAIQAEGWRWVGVMARIDYATLKSFDRLHPDLVPLTSEQVEERDRLAARYDALVDEHGDEPADEVLEELEKLDAQIAALSEHDEMWSDDNRAIAGVLVGIDADGGLRIERGLVRAEDRPARHEPDAKAGEGREEGAAPLPDTKPGLSAPLVEELTAERTAALRAVMLGQPKVALAALAHALALPLFYRGHQTATCLTISLSSRSFDHERAGQSAAAELVNSKDGEWRQRLPEEAADLFDWLLAQEPEVVSELLTFCTAMSIDAVQGRHDHSTMPRLAHAADLARALDLDMAAWWQPTATHFFSRVSKRIILDAVAEGASRQAADNLVTLKKDALAVRAEERLAGSGWLPTILRKPEAEAADEPDQLAEAAE